jgi:hypothetical protein
MRQVLTPTPSDRTCGTGNVPRLLPARRRYEPPQPNFSGHSAHTFRTSTSSKGSLEPLDGADSETDGPRNLADT